MEPLPPRTVCSRSGMRASFTSGGALQRFDAGDRSLLLYPAGELDAGPTNLYLRIRGAAVEALPLLGSGTPSRIGWTDSGPVIAGEWRGLEYLVEFRLADELAAWFWHVSVTSARVSPTDIDVVYTHDIALAGYPAVRGSEYYVSQYLDLTPIETSSVGIAVAVRQNMPGPTAPWAVVGCLTECVGWCTDALQLVGRGHRAGPRMPGLQAEALPSSRLQHEHTLAGVQSRPARLAAGETLATGFFGVYLADHPEATSSKDASIVEQALALSEARQPANRPSEGTTPERAPSPASLFSPAATLACTPLEDRDLSELTGSDRTHVEMDGDTLLSYFTNDGAHVVTLAKQAGVLRPHGHLMRTGAGLTPDERSLTTTAWMAGSFHSQVTQGHATLGRILSTRRGYLGLQQANGLRVFVASPGAAGGWALLDEPSAWAVRLDSCTWWYRHQGGLLEVVSLAPADAHELGLRVRVVHGDAARFLVCAHVAFGGDDGQDPEPPVLEPDESGVTVRPPHGAPGSFRLSWPAGSIERLGRDEALFHDGRSRRLPWITALTPPTANVELTLTADLVPATTEGRVEDGRARFWEGIRGSVRLQAPAGSPLATEVAQLDRVLPWFAHDALVHYLSPRGLEQYTGGAWGTRDVCQGPVGLLIALGEMQPLRDLILRVLRAQNARGDWPQAFEFYPRHFEGGQRESHGDVVFWPVLALAEYLAASGDHGLLAERIPFVDDQGSTSAEPVLEHVRRALAVISSRTLPGSPLPAYGHGDWNDSLQPADPRLAARLCSTWTAVLQVHTLEELSRSLRAASDDGQALDCANQSERIATETAKAIHAVLMRDGLLSGYGLFAEDGSVEHLVHPADRRTGLSYGVLQMIHAVSGDLLSPQEAREHLRILQEHLVGPDGARLFDRPPRYQGGPMEVFKRAEASTFFGREIGLMYTHAHLRYAEALARHGDSERLLHALALANPIGVTERVPNARPRQSTCYYSSSDAAFADRYEAAARYPDVMRALVPLEGGWRVYSSGPGIFLRLVVECLLGIRRRGDRLEVDPVLAPGLDGLQACVPLNGGSLELTYRVGTRGVAPHALRLNGVALRMEKLANPYRPAGVAIDLSRIGSGRNHMEVDLS